MSRSWENGGGLMFGTEGRRGSSHTGRVSGLSFVLSARIPRVAHTLPFWAEWVRDERLADGMRRTR